MTTGLAKLHAAVVPFQSIVRGRRARREHAPLGARLSVSTSAHTFQSKPAEHAARPRGASGKPLGGSGDAAAPAPTASAVDGPLLSKAGGDAFAHASRSRGGASEVARPAAAVRSPAAQRAKAEQAAKRQAELGTVLRASVSQLEERVTDGVIAVTSFRKGGQNAKHALLKQVEESLKMHAPVPDRKVDYVHYQSSYENSLFGYSYDEHKDKNLDVADGLTYKDLNMREYWFVEWLEVVIQCYMGGGYLIIFDLAGDAAMSTSVNCAMELVSGPLNALDCAGWMILFLALLIFTCTGDALPIASKPAG